MSEPVKIEQLKKQRAAFKGRLTNLKTQISSAVLIGDCEYLLSRVQSIYEKYDGVQSKIELVDENATNDRTLFEEEYGHLESTLRNKIHQLKKTDEAAVAASFHNTSFHDLNSSAQSVPGIRLPELILPSFSGLESDWLAFRDIFLDLIHSKNLEPNTKFLYLISCIRVGTAYSIIESLPVTGANYEIAWNSLCEKYNNEIKIQRFHTSELYNVQTPQEHSAKSLQCFVDKVSKHYNALKSLKVNVENWDLLLICHLLNRLDNSSRIHIIKTSKPNVIMSFPMLVELLQTRVRVLDALSSGTSQQSTRSTKQYNKVSLNAYGTSTSSSRNCEYCSGSHILPQCPVFGGEGVTPKTRFYFVKDRRICGNCLIDRHRLRDCNAPSCKKCSLKHHVLLHFSATESFNHSITPTVSCSSPSNNDDNYIAPCETESTAACPAPVVFNQLCLKSSDAPNRLVLLGTALINISAHGRTPVLCRALLDSVSTMNFITSNLCSLLKVSKLPTAKTISGIGANETLIGHTVNLTLSSRVSNYTVDLKFYVLPKITNMVPCMTVSLPPCPMKGDIHLADPSFNIPDRIAVLLGAEIYHDLFLGSSVKLYDELPPFLASQLGYIVCGSSKINLKVNDAQSHIALCSLQTLDTQMKKFWELESLPVKPIWSKEEVAAESHYHDNVTRTATGRYCVSLPTKPLLSHLGKSHTSAYRQFLALESRLNNNPEVRQLYHEFITEYRTLGHMTPVDHRIEEILYYLPHHYVIKEASITTKLRVVFNASSRTSSNISLNDCLMVDPTVQQDLFSILLRFRKHVVAFSGDIAKMYRQILVNDDHINLQRILWRDRETDRVQMFNLRTVTYGTACAPFLATRTLLQLASDEQGKFPAAAKVLTNDFYVDDVLTGATTVDDAIKLKRELRELLLMGGFELRKFSSNEVQLASEQDEPTPVALVLGLNWNTTSDHFEIHLNKLPISSLCTKRTVLSQICQLFDPFGICAPIIVTAKLIMQSIWVLQEIGWDDSLPPQLINRWTTFKEELHKLAQIAISRPICAPGDKRLELHGFCDASEKAYGCVIYTRSESIENKYRINLLCAKSKVSPLKKETIPRLELCAAVLLAELISRVLIIMDLTVHQVYLWTDSTVTLFRIQSEAYKYQTFVANRITKIQELTSSKDWHYVHTTENPADPISRGLSPAMFLSHEIWWNGPVFLKNPSSTWNIIVSDNPTEDLGALESRKPSNLGLLQQSLIDHSLLNKFQSFIKLVRVTAYILRFYSCVGSKIFRAKQVSMFLTPTEIESATLRLIKLVQELYYAEDSRSLKRFKHLPAKSSIIALSPFLDTHNILRVGGRLVNANINEGQKHPILLPGCHVLSTLIVRHEHERLLHAGPQALLYNLRRSYWIGGGRNLCRSIVHQCVRCFRSKPKSRLQVMGDLPADRSSRSRTKFKCYICVFVCFATKAIHLELVLNATTDSFIACLRRFIGRRGLCSKIYSDNATNFIGSRSELEELNRLFVSLQFQDATSRYCSNQNIEWNTIPPRSPHFGGLWEAAVKSAKHHLKRVAGSEALTTEEFLTLLCQIEACLNSRPLIPLSSDPNDIEALTPGHFLIGAPLTAIPEPSILHLNASRLSRFQRIQQMTQRFWERWSIEYLSELQKRKKWNHSPFEVQIGSLVIIHDDNLPPIKWHLGRIVELHPGKDGIVRVVTLKTASTILKRAVNRISVLPIHDIK